MAIDNKQLSESLLNLVSEAVKVEAELRTEYQIGDKFRFVRDRLQQMLAYVKEELVAKEKATESTAPVAAEDEQVVYVYLFNAQGLVLQTWQKMLTSSVFYDHSINRPIYGDQSHVESIIKGKPNKIQHGYLSVIIKKQDILSSSVQDPNGNPLLKVKEGALRFERRLLFVHGGLQYTIGPTGALVKVS